MLFILSKVFWIFAAPVNAALILCIVGIVLLWTRWARTGRWLVSLGIAVLLVVAALPIGGILTVVLEARFPPQATPYGEVDGIIVLGGSTSPGLTEARGQPALNAAAERLIAFAELSRRYPEAKLVFYRRVGIVAPWASARSRCCRPSSAGHECGYRAHLVRTRGPQHVRERCLRKGAG